MSKRSSTPRASASPTASSLTTTSRLADETTPLTGGGDPKMSGKRRVFLLACLCYAIFIANIATSILIPLFPPEAALKATTVSESKTVTTHVGFVFSTFAFVVVVASPILGTYVREIGPRFMLASGAFLVGGATALFGTIHYIDDWTSFLVIAYVSRAIQGFGAALLYTATWTIAATKFRDNVSTVLGILEMGLGVGYVVGPATGGGLFRLAGFPAPFFIIGGLILIGVVLFPFAVRDSVVTQQTTEATVPKLLRNFWIWMTSLSLMISVSAWGFINTTSSMFLHGTFGFDPALVGLMMSYYFVFYITSSPIIGRLATKFGQKKFLIPGILIQGVAMLFLGPSFLLTILPKKQSLWLFLTTSAVFAVSSSCVAPCVADMLRSAERMGYSKSVALNGVVSGLASSFFFLGEFLGPVVSGLLARVMDYQHSSTVFGLFLAAFAYLYLVIALCFRNRL
ncbi:MFS-type transporter SLC18B1-like [Oscarella lobularis]|uniref:MFS-type transporter SLC18B1-like n=1 Tax=Oscarella lobularis TaxID=121494 RepID=UPI0033143D8D